MVSRLLILMTLAVSLTWILALRNGLSILSKWRAFEGYPLGFAVCTNCFEKCTNCCANVNSDVRKAPKRLRKTVNAGDSKLTFLHWLLSSPSLSWPPSSPSWPSSSLSLPSTWCCLSGHKFSSTSQLIFSLVMQRGKKQHACRNHPLHWSPVISSHAASIALSRDHWIWAWCLYTIHL